MRRKPLTAEERQDEEGNHGDCAGGIGNSNVYVCVRVAPQFAWTGSRRRAILAVWVSGRGLHVLEEFGAIPSPPSRGVSAAGPMRSKASMSRTDTAPERMTAAASTAAAGRARSASWPAQGAPCRVVPSGAESGHPRRRSGSGCADGRRFEPGRLRQHAALHALRDVCYADGNGALECAAKRKQPNGWDLFVDRKMKRATAMILATALATTMAAPVN